MDDHHKVISYNTFKKNESYIWLKLIQILPATSAVYRCASYIQPQESLYFNEDICPSVKAEIISFQTQGKQLCRDLKARIGTKNDIIPPKQRFLHRDVNMVWAEYVVLL